MKATYRDAGWRALIGCLIVVGCAGKNLNHVGDVNDAAGAAGDDSGAGAQSSGPGGKSSGTAGMAGQPVIDEPGGNGPVIDGPGGAGGAGDEGVLVCETCELIAETPDIRGIWAGADQLYWIEYGSFDELENYLDNGRLMSAPLEGGTPEAVVSDLQGPRQLAMSEDYAYVLVDRSSSVSGVLQLVQIALDTGQAIPLSSITSENGYYYGSDWGRRFFAAAGGYAFWFNDGKVFRFAEEGTGQPEPVLTLENASRLIVDATNLYVQHHAGIETMPVSGDSWTTLWLSDRGDAFSPLVVAGDYFYGIDLDQPYVTRLPLTGGSMKNISPVAAFWATHLVIDGDRFVGDLGVWLDNSTGPIISGIAEGILTDADSPRYLATAPQWRDDYSTFATWRAWDATATTVYLGYKDELYRVAREQ